MGRQPSKESKLKWLEANRDLRPFINKGTRLRTFYGIMPDEYCKMFEIQDNKCAICQEDFTNDKKSFPHVDHNHDSGWVRGILCASCNFGIGHFKDNYAILLAAADYIANNPTPPEFNIFAQREQCKELCKNTRRKRRPLTEAEKERLRKARLGQPAWNKGIPWNQEARDKMSATRRAKLADPILGPFLREQHRLASLKRRDRKKDGQPV